MNKFDEFCNLVLEAYGQKVSVPYDGRTAPDRFNNPGGAYPKKGFEKYGMQGYDIIGGGHPIAKYPTLGHGIAANIAHLKSMPIVGKTVGQARHYWVNGNFNGSKPLAGMDSKQVITKELLNDPNWLAQWMRSTAKDEGFMQNGREIDDGSLNQAFAILKSKSNLDPTVQYASSGKLSPINKAKLAAKKVEPKSNTAPPSPDVNEVENDTERNAEIAKIAEDPSLTPEEKQSKFQELLQKAEESPFVADVKSKIKDIYAKGLNKDTALQALATASKAGQAFFKQYSRQV